VTSAIASILPVLIPALLTFVAALIATTVGYRQWRKQHTFERAKGFFDARAAAYKELWDRLETIDLRLRQIDVLDDEFDDAVRDLNAFVLRSEIYFEPGIRARVKSYYDSAREVSRIVHSYPVEELRRERGITEEGAIAGADMQEISEALRTADAARVAIMAEVRTNIGG
jgi:hypothetical protein